jgi:hypothetical protein
LHFLPVNESVTANLDFHPFFRPFWAQIDPKSAIFCQFYGVAITSLYHILIQQESARPQKRLTQTDEAFLLLRPMEAAACRSNA